MSTDDTTPPATATVPVPDEQLAKLRERFGGAAAVAAAAELAKLNGIAAVALGGVAGDPVAEAAAVELARLVDEKVPVVLAPTPEAAAELVAERELARAADKLRASHGLGPSGIQTPAQQQAQTGLQSKCPTCAGTGMLTNACRACHGAGIVVDNVGTHQTCGRCRGTRYEVT